MKRHIAKKEGINHNQNDYVDLLKCDKKWSICLLDFTYKNKVPEFFVFRVDPKNYHIIDDYFYPEEHNDCLSPTTPQYR